ncbi:hypothetical protein EB151_12320, partial [archaeon]|nr:hypothetical protein [archaeon]
KKKKKKKNLNENDYHYENENYSHLEVKKIGKEKIAWILKGYPVALASTLKLSKLIRGYYPYLIVLFFPFLNLFSNIPIF